MDSHRNCIRFAAAVGALALGVGLAGSARAVDGVIEINQASVKAAGGFPFVISNTGSYRLTSNLDVTDASARPMGMAPENTTAIKVSADDVSVDLNGFTIKGPTVCSGSPINCSPKGTGMGIDFSGYSGGNVTNGTVRGMGFDGVVFAGLVEKVRAISNGGHGIQAVTATNCAGEQNLGDGIVAEVVTGSRARLNGSDGIAASKVANSEAVQNRLSGFIATNVSGCVADGNLAVGIVANVATGCEAKNNSTQILAAGITGLNICAGVPCP